MAKKKQDNKIFDKYFHQYLWEFYKKNQGHVQKGYKKLSRAFLKFNDKDENPNAYLRKPQSEALEIYIFLKEYLENEHIQHIFENWYNKEKKFEKRRENIDGTIFESEDEKAFKHIYNQMRKEDEDLYPSYLFALTMGLGKTTLMATCIFYEFLLANKFSKNSNYCHNVLVLAPDKTVLESLKEIQTLDKSLIVPPEYISWLETNLKFHVLDGDGTLTLLAKSKFNIIIANNQKVILKTRRKKTTSASKLFEGTANIYQSKEAEAREAKEQKEPKRRRGGALDEIRAMVSPQEIKDETEIINNSRFAQLAQLEQLGIYVDEAHHIFGKDAAKSRKALKKTVDELAANLHLKGTKLVATYNFSGTPYLEGNVLPQVVYEYGLKKSIDNNYLKKASIKSFENAKSKEIVKVAIKEFWEKYGSKTFENLKPKMAIYAPNINELTTELRPIVEEVLIELGIPTSSILVNVGDDKHTSNDDIVEFNRLDTPSSNKQFILLVNKGKEGWNCRSLFSVVLYRKPDSKNKIFVLQATMRCLRQIGNRQETGLIFLDKENENTLDEQLSENFQMSLKDMKEAGEDDKEDFYIKVNKPIKKITFRRKITKFEVKEKEVANGFSFAFHDVDKEKYKITVSSSELGKIHDKKKEEINDIKEKRVYSSITLIAELSKYLNKSCLDIKKIISSSNEGMEVILKEVNEYNEVLYDHIIPKLFDALFVVDRFTKIEDVTVDLVKEPNGEGEGNTEGTYRMRAKPSLTVKDSDPGLEEYKNKSFHVDTYCFDSNPENQYFWNALKNDKVKEVYFTGMLTHGQSDFVINYYDPETEVIRSYYPDFLLQMEDGSYEIIEVKGDNKIDDVVVQAKKSSAEELLSGSAMTYRMLRSSDLTEVGVDHSGNIFS
ncbi:DEAD/DEAH box helicase family protein [Flammeovirga sp. SJP92]|uniref:DEAD/DEAH box helicase family protein n=1 Tax=Flammeovirga sp. SJP92 TaxID=1775430 RepID=UPI000787F42F|nr:DEAD/DEAH box helicase family protein [Flammeovirga sp. SJP92]KXX67411.1 hypothetical protein AVL50_26950 [Flammeovirga sp. SJP92]